MRHPAQAAADMAYDYVRATSEAPVIRLAEPLVDAGHRAANPQELTEREHEVLRALASGASNKELAVVLGIRPKTVMHHTSSIYRKLSVRGRAEAVAHHLRHGHHGQHGADGQTGRAISRSR